jgi:F0F1-type ATP synthase membrane subunit b/b'
MLVATLLIAAPEAKAQPLIDVDGTLFIQFALFLIMIAVCSRLLFKPYLKLRDTRHAKNEGAREEAVAMQERAREIVAQYDAQLQRARLRGGEERQRLRSEGAAHEREVLGRARDEAQKALEAARLRISTEASAARIQLQIQSVSLAKQIVKKVLGREVA